MALVHDIAEAIVGDIAPGDGISDNDKHSRELVWNLNRKYQREHTFLFVLCDANQLLYSSPPLSMMHLYYLQNLFTPTNLLRVYPPIIRLQSNKLKECCSQKQQDLKFVNYGKSMKMGAL